MEEVKKEFKVCIEKNENGYTTTQNLWDSVRSCAKRQVHSNTSSPQETRETTNKKPNFTPKATRKKGKEEQTKLIEGKKSEQK